MSKELRAAYQSGVNLYAAIMDGSGQWWNGSTFEDYSEGNYSDYAVALTEQGTSGVYVADFPTGITDSGSYSYFVYYRVGSSPAAGDTPIETGKVVWTGAGVAADDAVLISVASVRDHVETDLPDTALQRLINDANAEIIDRLGELSTATEHLDGDRFLFLSRKADSISSIVERYGWPSVTETTLVATDYKLFADGLRLERLLTGTNPYDRWRGTVTVIYAPKDETASRIRLLIDLVELAARHSGFKSTRFGDLTTEQHDYQAAREALFRSFLGRNRRLIA